VTAEFEQERETMVIAKRNDLQSQEESKNVCGSFVSTMGCI
jgi:hypothetical protein